MRKQYIAQKRPHLAALSCAVCRCLVLPRLCPHPKIASHFLLEFPDHCRIVLWSALVLSVQVPLLPTTLGAKWGLAKKGAVD